MKGKEVSRRCRGGVEEKCLASVQLWAVHTLLPGKCSGASHSTVGLGLGTHPSRAQRTSSVRRLRTKLAGRDSASCLPNVSADKRASRLRARAGRAAVIKKVPVVSRRPR